MSARHPSKLREIIARSSRLQASTVIDGEPIEQGRIYVAPPDNHVILADGFARLVHGAKENGHRPAVDPLFRTAARVYGPRVVGVVLSGTLDCGTLGLQEVKRHGGIAVVQDPEEAKFAGMPQSALNNVAVDYCLPVDRISEVLTRLSREPAVARGKIPSAEVEEPEQDFTCPACGGHLTRAHSDAVLSFGCKVGHRYSLEALEEEQSEALESALWVALRAIEDRTALSRRLVARAVQQSKPRAVAYFEEQIQQSESQAALVRKALQGAGPHNDSEAAAQPSKA